MQSVGNSDAVPKLRERTAVTFAPATLFSLIFTLLAVMLLSQRLKYGISLTDESYYLATSLSFLRGAVPFHSILGLHQLSALMTAPLLKLWIEIVHSTDRLMLVSRCAYLILTAITATSFYFYARRNLSTGLSLLTSLSFIAFIPFGLPALSYNTLAMGFFAIGCALLGICADNGTTASPAASPAKQSVVLPIASGLIFSLAIFSYPSFIIPTALLFYMYRQRFQSMPVVLAAAVTLSLLLIASAVVLICLGWDTLIYNAQFSLSFNERPLPAKLLMLADQLLQFCGHKWYVTLALISAAIFTRQTNAFKNTHIYLIALGLFLASVSYSLGDFPQLFTQSHDLVLSFALLGTPIFLFRRFSFLSALFWVGIISGAISSLSTSSNGLVNFCVGGFLCVPSTITQILQDLCIKLRDSAQPIIVCAEKSHAEIDHSDELTQISAEEHAQASGNIRALSSLHFFAYAFAVWAEILFLIPSLTNLYGELARKDCVSKVHQGIFRGLYTSPQRAQFIETVQEALARHEAGNRTIRVIGDAGGYLLSSLRPSAPTLHSGENKWFNGMQSYYKRYYNDAGQRPDLILVIPKATGEQPCQAELAVIHDYDYRIIDKGNDFTLYERK